MLDGTELVPVVWSGLTYQTTVNAIGAFIGPGASGGYNFALYTLNPSITNADPGSGFFRR